MKIYKYKFTRLLKALMVLGMVLCALGFGVNLYYCIVNGARHAANPIYPIMQYVLMFFVTVVLFVLLLSIMLRSAYVIDGKVFKTRFGLITSKYDIEKIENITLDRKTDKLTVAFSSGEFIVIVVKQQWYDEFVTELLLTNPKIKYDIISLDNNDQEKKA